MMLYNTFSVAVLEFLSTATWTRIISARQLVLDDGIAGLLGPGVLSGSCLLVLVHELLLVTSRLFVFCVLLSVGVLLGSSLLYFTVLHLVRGYRRQMAKIKARRTK